MLTRLILITMLFATACAPRPLQEDSGSPSSTQKSNPSSPSLPQLAATPDSAADKLVALALADLSDREAIDPANIHLLSAKPMTWPDAALGCRLPDSSYGEGAVPGYQISLEAGGRYYVYHTDLGSQIILCPEVKPDEPGLR